MPTDGAVQSRDRSLWQSTEEAADEHGILIIKHNEKWSISKQEKNSIYYAKVKNKSVNKAIAQNGVIPGFLHLCMRGCSFPGERNGSSYPFSRGLEPHSPVLDSHHHSQELQIKRIYCTGLLPSPQPNPRLQSQDTLACHRASPHHPLGVGSKSSTLFPKVRPQAQHEASTAHQQPGVCCRPSGGQERGNNRWPFSDLCRRVYGQWIWELHCFTREQTGRKNPLPSVIAFFFLARWTETKCIWYPYWHLANKEQGLAAYLPVKYK